MDSRKSNVALGVAAGGALFFAGVAAGANPGFSAGLAAAAQSVGQNIVGDGKFFSVRTTEPDGPDLEWNIFMVDNPDYRTGVNVLVRDAAGALRTGYRLEVSAGHVSLRHDPAATGVDNPDYRPDDLSGFQPPDVGD